MRVAQSDEEVVDIVRSLRGSAAVKIRTSDDVSRSTGRSGRSQPGTRRLRPQPRHRDLMFRLDDLRAI